MTFNKGDQRPRKRIGIFAGTFDPVHAGHIAYALQALRAAGLDEVVFLPERRPRHKPGVEHFAHRVAMIKQAIRPHPLFSILELVDRNFTVSRTLPQLQALFAGHQLVLLVGSDTVPGMPHWPRWPRLAGECGLIVGVRAGQNPADVQDLLDSWQAQPREIWLLDSYAAAISSTRIREALRSGQSAAGLLASVKCYARQEWLYVSPHVLTRNLPPGPGGQGLAGPAT